MRSHSQASSPDSQDIRVVEDATDWENLPSTSTRKSFSYDHSTDGHQTEGTLLDLDHNLFIGLHNSLEVHQFDCAVEANAIPFDEEIGVWSMHRSLACQYNLIELYSEYNADTSQANTTYKHRKSLQLRAAVSIAALLWSNILLSRPTAPHCGMALHAPPSKCAFEVEPKSRESWPHDSV